MNIIEHINAGHYLTDKIGRPHIRYKSSDKRGYEGWITVLATDGPKGSEITGRFSSGSVSCWEADGNISRVTINLPDMYLLPPPNIDRCEVCRDNEWTGCKHHGCKLGIAKEKDSKIV